jgi:hemolysin activation/secretion protein
MRRTKNLIHCVLVVSLFGLPFLTAAEKPVQQFQEQRQAEAAAKREKTGEAKANKKQQQSAEQLAIARLPEDITARLAVKEIRFTGNTLVSSAELFKNMPIIFNASDKPLAKAESKDLYDFRTVIEILSAPGTSREVSARTIQGLTQYVLSVYQKKNYGGIYVYVPADTLKGGAELKDGVLQVEVLEAHTSNVGIKYYDVNQAAAEKGHLDANVIRNWSPVKPGEVVNRKKLDDFVNLLNINPDRYVSAVVSKGTEPNSLAVNYSVYEANPWHYFIQVDNSGVKGKEWNTRFGIINTNLLGFDDSFFALYQVPLDSSWEDNYSLFGSYDFPLAGPGLRLNIYGGYSEFDLSSNTSGIDFIGGGKFIGANLRYNIFQTDGWFFDVIGSISEEKSKTTPSLFPEFLASDVRMDLWGYAVDIHKRDDISNTSLGYQFTGCMGGSGEEQFTMARTDAERDFTIHSISALHSRYIDPNKISRISGTFRWIYTEERIRICR